MLLTQLRTAPLFALALLVPAPATLAQAAVTAHVHTLDTLPIPSFSPADVSIRVGDRVEWDNHAPRVHTVTHDRCPRVDLRNDPSWCEFDTLRDRGSDLSTGATFVVTFDQPGIYSYVCAIHRFGGQITVLGETGALPNLRIGEISFNATPLGTSRRVQAEIVNAGEAAASGSRVYFASRPRGGDAWTRFGDVEIGPLSAGETRLVNQDWPTFNKIGDFEIRVSADGAATVLESDETDNSKRAEIAVLVPEGTLPGASLPDPPPPEPLSTRVPSPSPSA